ncbi:hypothetical protein Tco_1000949 [Tanacetum coccineum]
MDAIKAKLEANAELTKDVLGKNLPEQDFAKGMAEMVNQRKNHFAEERAKAKRNKPMYSVIIDTFVPINLKATKAKLKRYGEELQTKTSKKQSCEEKTKTKFTRSELLQIKEMADQDTPPPTITAMKIPIIKKGEYDIWSMRMRQYICHTDHNLWDIIVNGDLEDEATPSGEQSSPPVPKTAKQLAARRNQERIKSILLLAIPDEYLLKFHNVPDAKSLWAAIKSRFGGNEESKKMQKNVLKHQFENFVTASNETLDKAYDRFHLFCSKSVKV